MGIDLGSVDALQSALTYHRERHTVLAGNVANLDTPGYRPADLTRHVEAEAGGVAMTTDAAGQMAAPGGGTSPDTVLSFDDGGGLQGPDGNAVSLERELAKIDANRTRYAASSELVSRRMAMLKYAAGDGT